MTAQHSDLGNIILESIEKYSFSEIVVIELLAALRNFSRQPSKAVFIAKNRLNTVVQMALAPLNEKV